MKRSRLHPFALLLSMALGGCGPAADSTAVPSPNLVLEPIPHIAEQSTDAGDTAAPPAPLPGVEAYRRSDYTTAFPLLKREAGEGDAEAQYLLGELHFQGLGTPRNYAQARHWLGQAADQQHPRAQHRLAEIHAYGYGVPRDTVAANHWEGRARANGWASPSTEGDTAVR